MQLREPRIVPLDDKHALAVKDRVELAGRQMRARVGVDGGWEGFAGVGGAVEGHFGGSGER